MSRILAKKVKLRGISKNKVLLGVAVIIILLLIALLFDGNDMSDNQESSKTAYGNPAVYVNSTNSVDSTSSIIEKAEHMRKLSASKDNAFYSFNTGSSPTKPIPLSEDTSKIEVPPIIMSHNLPQNTTINRGLNRSREQNIAESLDTNPESKHAKSLVFFRVANEIGSKPNDGQGSIASVEKSPKNASDASVSQASYHDNNPDYLQSDLKSPISVYELKAGSIIPATMINGLNSDLPGSVIAFVRSNVYDTVSRRYILIPQGSKLFGVYDSQVLYGQERVAVAWNRLIYPDGSSINLKGMPGSDLEGYSGFHDKVDNKYWRLFGTSFIMGVISGAMQYSQNNISNNNGTNNPTVGQTMAGSLGQQMGQTGLAVTQKNLTVKPTLTIRPNYPFSIMITADLVLKPWKNPS